MTPIAPLITAFLRDQGVRYDPERAWLQPPHL